MPAAPLLFTSRKRDQFFGIHELLDMTPRTWMFREFVFVTRDDYSHDHDALCGVLLIRDHAPSFFFEAGTDMYNHLCLHPKEWDEAVIPLIFQDRIKVTCKVGGEEK